MKKLFTKSLFIAILVALVASASAQTDSVKVKGMGKNLFKVSLTSLALNTYSFSYERKIGNKISLGLGYRVMPEGELPLKSNFESIIDDPETFKHVDNLITGNTAFTPEIKFYFGKGVFRGFYIAPYARIAKYTGKLPFDFEYDDDANTSTPDKSATINMKGDISTVTGGLSFGAQWKLSKIVYLDWSILGPAYGSSKGSITGTMAELSDANVRAGLKEELKKIEDSGIPLVKITTQVTDKEARADFTGPWANIRASIGLGFRF